MRSPNRLLLAFALLPVLGGCGNKPADVEDSAGSLQGEPAKPGSTLAYEHSLRIQAAPETMQARVDELRAACNDARFGACSLLEVEVTAGDWPSASIAVRTVPAAVEPFVKLAARGNRIAWRQTHAEDLAEAIATATDRRGMLERQRDALAGMQSRKDLTPTDLVSIAQQAAAVEQALQSLAQEGAERDRRIETNKLTIAFASNRGDASSLGVGDLWEQFSDSFVEGVANAAEYLGYLLPLIFIAFPLALGWRAAWRRVTRR